MIQSPIGTNLVLSVANQYHKYCLLAQTVCLHLLMTVHCSDITQIPVKWACASISSVSEVYHSQPSSSSFFLVFFNLCTIYTVLHAFIFSCPKHCNAWYTGISQSSLHRLQLAQKASVWILTATKKNKHITCVLANLQWLPISFWIDFNIC